MAWTLCCDEKVTPGGELSAMRDRFRLMLITEPEASASAVVATIQAAIRGGITAVQVRRPGASAAELFGLVRSIRQVTRAAEVLLLVNDRVDVALAARADGVHLKGSSLPLDQVRSLVGTDFLIGVSTHEEAEVAAAHAGGADYAVFGPVFPTPSKEGILLPRGATRYAAAAALVSIPVLALGGVDLETLPALLNRPVPGVAVIRAISARRNPEIAARELRLMLEERQ